MNAANKWKSCQLCHQRDRNEWHLTLTIIIVLCSHFCHWKKTKVKFRYSFYFLFEKIQFSDVFAKEHILFHFEQFHGDYLFNWYINATNDNNYIWFFCSLIRKLHNLDMALENYFKTVALPYLNGIIVLFWIYISNSLKVIFIFSWFDRCLRNVLLLAFIPVLLRNANETLALRLPLCKKCLIQFNNCSWTNFVTINQSQSMNICSHTFWRKIICGSVNW